MQVLNDESIRFTGPTTLHDGTCGCRDGAMKYETDGAAIKVVEGCGNHKVWHDFSQSLRDRVFELHAEKVKAPPSR